jgi:DNA-binding GntR family transcriptional regulator
VGIAIIDGELLPGADLNTVDLSGQFKTSRTPVREALLLLEQERLVEIPPRRRPLVAPLTLKEVRDSYEARASLYGLVAELIVTTSSDEQIESLAPYLAAMEAAAASEDRDAYFWANVEFQNQETRICGNSQLERILDSLMLRMLQLRHLSLMLRGRMHQSLADHQAVFQAYRERDLELAVAMNRGLVLRGLATIEKSGWAGLRVPGENS